MNADASLRLPSAPAADRVCVDDVQTQPEARRILGVRIDACSYESAAARILQWAAAAESRAVACANVHVVMEANDDESFAAAIESMDLATPDGMPLVWGLRRLGLPGSTRVYGPDLTKAVCDRAAREGVPVGFYGGTPDTLQKMTAALCAANPALNVAFAASPPFRAPSAIEDAETTHAIAGSGARIVFVGLGCPKQERWIAAHRGRIPAVLVGVGAAFDFIAGTKRQAPRFVQRAGLEWLFRLCSEPRRLWRRYLKHNPRFVLGFARQLRRGRAAQEGAA